MCRTPLVAIEFGGEPVMLDGDQLREAVRRDLQGADLVEDLLTERRAAAAAEDVDTASEPTF